MGIVLSPAEIDQCLIEMIAWAGNGNAASKALVDQGISVSPQTLRNWCRGKHQARYLELRNQFAADQEGQLVHTFRDMAARAVETLGSAIDSADERLRNNEDPDPGRTAANMARVAQSMTDKMLSLSGRPTSIREDRSLNEVLRSLAAKGIIEIPAVAEDESDVDAGQELIGGTA